MPDQIQNIVAEIYAIEDAGTRITLRDKAKKSLGSFFKTKQDGQPTVAYQQFQDLELKSGSVVQIGFKEVPYKDGKIKNIINFRETNEQAQSYQAPPKVVAPKVTETVYTANEPKDSEFWEKKALKQCMWQQAMKVGLENFGSKDCDLVWEIFKSIEMNADKRFGHITGEEIPF